MLSLLLTATVLTASPVKLASPALTGVNMKTEELAFYTDHLAQQLGFQGLRVITASEIQQLLGFERQKALLGCSDTSASCQAELANALGVDGLVTGSIGRVGKTLQLNLKIINAENGTPLAAYSARATSDEMLLDKLTEAAELMAKKVLTALHREPAQPEKQPVVADAPKVEAPPKVDAQPTTENVAPAVEVTREGGGLRPYAWIPAAGGVALSGVGAFFLVQANGKVDQIRNEPDDQAAENLWKSGKQEATTGAVLLGVGVAALAAGAGMYLFGGEGPQVALLPGPQPSAVLTGTFDLGDSR